MRCAEFLLLVLFLGRVTPLVHAQNVMEVDAKTIQQHINHKTFLAYPLIAKSAHVQGTVVFDLQIGVTGKIDSMNVVSGPPMLQQAAIDCLKQWTFHPFEKEGNAVAVHGQYSIIFVLSDTTNTTIGHGPSVPQKGKVYTVKVKSENAASGPDIGLNNKFDVADDACKKGILSQQFNSDTVSRCQKAATLADELPMEENYIAKRSAYVYAASAYADIGDFKSALQWAIKAVDVVKLGHDGDSGSSAAYEDKGLIEGNLDDLTAADQDLSVAEEYERKGIAGAEKGAEDVYAHYGTILARDLRYHAQILQKLNRPDEAQKKLDEAAQLAK